MRISEAIPGALISCAAGAILAGCGALRQAQGDMPPIAAPGAMPQVSTVAQARGPARNASAPYQVLYRFNFQHRVGSAQPLGGLLNVNGTLYGTTQIGGRGRRYGTWGTVYSITTTGTFNKVYDFRGGKKGDGAAPQSGLIDVNGTLYGTTAFGGSPGNHGTVYSLSTTGAEKVLHSFTASDGWYPNQGDLLYMNGTLYGTTLQGGHFNYGCSSSCGTVYSVTTSGEENVLYKFTGGYFGADGSKPSSGLINVKGTMYGTTVYGGGTGCAYKLGCGTVYSITPSGQEKVLYSFAGGTDGSEPYGLVNVKGTLYGTTTSGGTGCSGGCGTVYSITTSGYKKILYNFRGGSDGSCPSGPLIHVKSKLYGATYCGEGSSNGGTVYSVTTTGTEHVLYRFTNSADGFDPTAPLLNVNGTLYGTTLDGGESGNGWGVIYTLTP